MYASVHKASDWQCYENIPEILSSDKKKAALEEPLCYISNEYLYSFPMKSTSFTLSVTLTMRVLKR